MFSVSNKLIRQYCISGTMPAIRKSSTTSIQKIQSQTTINNNQPLKIKSPIKWVPIRKKFNPPKANVSKPKNIPVVPSALSARQSITAVSSEDGPLNKEEAHKERLRINAERKVQFEQYLSNLPDLKEPSYYSIECYTKVELANKKLEELMKNKPRVVGLDLEWQPTFAKNQPEKKVALVQICTGNSILLFQLPRLNGVPEQLRKFFEEKEIFKTGVNIAADGSKLERDFGIVTNGLIDLRDMANNITKPLPEMFNLRSLRALTGIFLKQNMSKGKVRLSNWSNPHLTSKQIKYAALDAYASYQLYVVLKDLQNTKNHINVHHLLDGKPTPLAELPKTLAVVGSPKKLPFQEQPTSTVTIIKRKADN